MARVHQAERLTRNVRGTTGRSHVPGAELVTAYRVLGTLFTLGLMLVGTDLVLASETSTAGTKEPIPLHITFSSSLFTEVNKADANAAVKAWAEGWSRNHTPPMTLSSHVAESGTVIDQVTRNGRSEFAVVASDEFFARGTELEVPTLLLSVIRDQHEETYVLLVRSDSAIGSIEDLRGRSLNLLEGARASMAPYWLETTLLEAGLPPMEECFGSLNRQTKLTSAVLPVFFGQVDACVVTRHGLDDMAELNPQVGRQLRVLAESPGLIPVICFFSPGFDLEAKSEILVAMTQLGETAFGSQILTLFQADQIVDVPVSRLDPTHELYLRHSRLLELHEGGPPMDPGAAAIAGGN